MLSNQKPQSQLTPKSHRQPSSLKNLTHIAQKLQTLWRDVELIQHQVYFHRTHTLLLEMLTLLERHGYRKPDWRAIFYKHLTASLKSSCNAIPFYYFRLATTLSTQLSLSCLIRLLNENCELRLPQTPLSLKQLKISYNIGHCDSKEFERYFDFLEKVSVKLFKFIAGHCSPQCEQLYTYYLSIVISCSKQYSFRFRKIVTVAFDSYCKYSLINVLPLKWNIFEIMTKILNFYETGVDDQCEDLFFCCLGFINLIGSAQVVRYVSQASNKISICEHMSTFMTFLSERAATQRQSNRQRYSQLIEYTCLKMVLNGSSSYYFDLTLQPNLQTLWSQAMLVMKAHSQAKSFNTLQNFEYFSKWLSFVDEALGGFQKGSSQEIYLRTVAAFIVDINNFINRDVVPMVKKYDLTDLLSINREDMSFYVAFLPLYRFLAKYSALDFRNVGFNPENLQAVSLQKIFCCLLIICILSNSENSQKTLLNYLTNEYAKFITQAKQSICLLRILVTVNRLASTKHCKLAYKVVSTLTKTVRFHELLYQLKSYTIFTVLKRSYRKCEICRDESCKVCKQGNIFGSRIFYEQFKQIITLLIARGDNCFKNEQLLFQEMIQVLIKNYNALQDDCCVQAIELLQTYTTNQQKSDFLLSRCKKAIFETISSDNFSQLAPQKTFLLNGLGLYRNLLSKKGKLKQMQYLQLIDCVANLKRMLSALIFQKKGQNEAAEVQFLQMVIDQSQAMQHTYLQQPARDYIEQLCESFGQNKNLSFEEFVSICLKSIYYVIFSEFEPSHPAETAGNNLQQTDSVEQMPPKNEYQFLSAEIEEMGSKLKIIKQKLKRFEEEFRRFGVKMGANIIETQFERYNIEIGNQSFIQTVLWQLNDLIYLAFLTDLQSTKMLLISYRLSLLLRYSTKQILLIQFSKLLLYNLITPQQQITIKKVIVQQLRTQARNNTKCEFISLLNLLTNGEADASLPQTSRILKIVYLLKNPAITYVNSIKPMVSYLFAYINSQGYNQGEVKSVGTLLKNATILYKDTQFDLNLQIQALLNGWSCLQLLCLFSRNILLQCVELNQVSKVKNFDRFSANLLVRSGNIAETDVLFGILYKKKKDIDWLKVADSLRAVVSSEICANQYKKIDRILCDKRKSLSFGVSFQKLTNIINLAFRKSGKIGTTLTQIFMLILKDMLNVDEWLFWRCRSQMQLCRPQMRQSFIECIEKLQVLSNRSLVDEIAFDIRLAGNISKNLFQSYREASALRDYIAQFINLAIQEPQSLNSSQNLEVDRLIAFLALNFEEFNFHMKDFWFRHSQNFSLSDSFQMLKSRKEGILRDYNEMKNSYERCINQKMQQLQKCRYPLSFLFPLGRYLYNLAWKDGLLVTYVTLHEFQDKIDTVQKLIKSNNDILMLKDLNTQIIAQKRKGLDKEMGKVVASVDIGVVDQDTDFNPLPPAYAKMADQLAEVHPALLKFVRMDAALMMKHLRAFVTRFGITNGEEIGRKIQKVSKYVCEQNKQSTNILLYLHYKYLCFPFEGIEMLKEKGIFRVPSAQYLLKNKTLRTEHHVSSLKYLINTKNDLQLTQSKFQHIRKKFEGWVGIKGRQPSLTEVVHLFEKEVFLYMGHGIGLEHINPKQLGTLRIQCLMMVFGCSSAKMVFQQSEPHGWGLDALIRGCPGYLGCLWNVTDVDTDKITVEVFSRERSENLSVLVNRERKKCMFPNINGSALVIYGLPSVLIYN